MCAAKAAPGGRSHPHEFNGYEYWMPDQGGSCLLLCLLFTFSSRLSPASLPPLTRKTQPPHSRWRVPRRPPRLLSHDYDALRPACDDGGGDDDSVPRPAQHHPQQQRQRHRQLRQHLPQGLDHGLLRVVPVLRGLVVQGLFVGNAGASRQSNPIPSNPITSHRITSHHNTSRRITSHRITSRHIASQVLCPRRQRAVRHERRDLLFRPGLLRRPGPRVQDV